MEAFVAVVLAGLNHHFEDFVAVVFDVFYFHNKSESEGECESVIIVRVEELLTGELITRELALAKILLDSSDVDRPVAVYEGVPPFFVLIAVTNL